MLKFKYTKLEDIPATAKDFYEEKSSGGVTEFILKVEGVVESTRLDEFRNKNIALQREIGDFKTKFDGIDPQEVSQLREAVGGLKHEEISELLKAGKNVDKVVESRVKAVREENERAVTTLKGVNEKLQSRLEQVEIRQAAVTAAQKLGLRPTAVLDLAMRASQTFRFDKDGKVTPYELSDPSKVIYSGKTAAPKTIEEWAEDLLKEAPHLFEQSNGGGAQGGNAGGSGGGGAKYAKPNPWKKESKNLTEQMALIKSDYPLAQRLAGEAGVKIGPNPNG